MFYGFSSVKDILTLGSGPNCRVQILVLGRLHPEKLNLSLLNWAVWSGSGREHVQKMTTDPMWIWEKGMGKVMRMWSRHSWVTIVDTRNWYAMGETRPGDKCHLTWSTQHEKASSPFSWSGCAVKASHCSLGDEEHRITCTSSKDLHALILNPLWLRKSPPQKNNRTWKSGKC